MSMTTPASALGNHDAVVIVPMYNEAEVVTGVIRELRATFPNVVCVDDGSSDGSPGLAAAAGATLVSHVVNLGAGGAFQTGVEFALRRFPHAKYFVTFDADGQHRVDDAARLLESARSTDSDVVLGSRFMDDSTQMPWARRCLLRSAVVFTRVTTRLSLTDTHCGLRVLSRKAASAMRLRLPGMAHGSEILSTIRRAHLSYVEIPVTVNYSDYSLRKGQRGINFVNILFDLFSARVWSPE